MEYYIQGDPKQVDQIKDILVKAGYEFNFNCSDRDKLYFTIKGKRFIYSCGIKSTTAEIIVSATESYKKLQLPKFKVGDILQDKRISKSYPEKVMEIFPLHGYYRLLDNAGLTIDVPFECTHKYFDYYDEKAVLPFKAGDLVLVRDTNCHAWKVDVFSHITPYGNYKFVCAGGLYNQCIPFKENEQLVGKSQICCKQYPSICYGKT